MITDVPDGAGVLSGRYAGPAIEIHYGPTPQQVAVAAEDMPRMRWLVGVGAPPDKPASTTTAESVNPKTYNNADALLDVARVFLDAAPKDGRGRPHDGRRPLRRRQP